MMKLKPLIQSLQNMAAIFSEWCLSPDYILKEFWCKLFVCDFFFHNFICGFFFQGQTLLAIFYEWLVWFTQNKKERNWLDTGSTMWPWPLILPLTLISDFSKSNFEIAVSQELLVWSKWNEKEAKHVQECVMIWWLEKDLPSNLNYGWTFWVKCFSSKKSYNPTISCIHLYVLSVEYIWIRRKCFAMKFKFDWYWQIFNEMAPSQNLRIKTFF